MSNVIVVGGGVIGLSTAYQLAKRGHKVRLLEQAPVGHNVNNGSHGETRIIRLIHSDPIYLSMALESYRMWRQIEHTVGTKLYENHGLLWIGDKESSLKRSKILNDFNAPNEFLTGKQINERYAMLNYDYGEDWYACLDHTAGTIYARKSTEALTKCLRSLKVTIHYDTKVTGWKSNGQTVTVNTTNGTFTANSIVFATGGWSSVAVPGLAVSIKPSVIGVFFWDVKKEGQGLYDPFNRCPNVLISDIHNGEELFMLPYADYQNKIKFAIHTSEAFDIVNGKPPKALIDKCREGTKKHLKRHFKYIEDDEPSVECTCLYAMTDDHSFVIDHHPQHKNVILASGFSGTGFKFGPCIGDIVADMIDGKKSRFDLSPFSVNRIIDTSKAKL